MPCTPIGAAIQADGPCGKPCSAAGCGREGEENVMSLRRSVISASVVILSIITLPSRASADWLFTPFVGTAFNSSADFDDGFPGGDEFERRFTYGASLGYMGAGVVGFEIDFGYSPNFFETFAGGDDDFTFADDSNVTTLMGNVLVGIPIGGQTGLGIRPYVVGGAGLLRTHVVEASGFFEDLNSNDFGFNIGGGVNGFFTDNIGIRGDIRYFRAFADDDEDDLDLGLSDFDFWRATVGVTFRFGGS
jgi:opacity protein-like surface antigen